MLLHMWIMNRLDGIYRVFLTPADVYSGRKRECLSVRGNYQVKNDEAEVSL